MFYVYILKNDNKEPYIGFTNNLERRLGEHKKYKKDYSLVYYEAYILEKFAQERERKLKYYGSAWRALKKRIYA